MSKTGQLRAIYSYIPERTPLTSPYPKDFPVECVPVRGPETAGESSNMTRESGWALVACGFDQVSGSCYDKQARPGALRTHQVPPMPVTLTPTPSLLKAWTASMDGERKSVVLPVWHPQNDVLNPHLTRLVDNGLQSRNHDLTAF